MFAAFLVQQSCQHLLCPGERVEAASSLSDDSYCQTSHLLTSSWFLLSAHYCPLLTFLFCDVFEGYLLPELCNYTRCHLSPVKMCFHCELLEIISALCRYNGYLLHIDNMTKISPTNNKHYLAKRIFFLAEEHFLFAYTTNI